MNYPILAALAAYAGVDSGLFGIRERPGEPESFSPGKRPVNPTEEVTRILGKNPDALWIHRTTKQCRYFHIAGDVVAHMQVKPNGVGFKIFERSFGETLQWLNNADVQAKPKSSFTWDKGDEPDLGEP